MNTYYPLLPPLAVSVFLLVCTICYYTMSDFSWAESILPRVDCYPHCYCERPIGGPIEQVSNSFSNFAYIIIGSVLAFLPIEPKSGNLYTQYRSFRWTFAMSVFVTGIGSFFYHTSLTEVGRFCDWLGMFLVASFILSYSVSRFFDLGPAAFRSLYFPLTAGILIVMETTWIYEYRTALFVGEFVLGVAISFAASSKRKSEFESRYLAMSLVCFFTGFGVWLLDRLDVVCWPDSVVQGHAIWHILTAVALFFAHFYLVSETLIAAELPTSFKESTATPPASSQLMSWLNPAKAKEMHFV